MPTENYGLPTITGNMTADVVRDVNALAEATDSAIKQAVDSVDLTEIEQGISDVDARLTTHLAQIDEKIESLESGSNGYGSMNDVPASPLPGAMFFLTNEKKRIEFNGEKWQYLDGTEISKLQIVDGNIYTETASYTPFSLTSTASTTIQNNIEMTKDFIWYSNIQLADNNDFVHFQFREGTSVKLDITFGYNWVTGAKDGSSIGVYDYSNASKVNLGAVDFYTESHDVILWYDHKWGYFNIYVDNVLIGSFKPSSGGTNLNALNNAYLKAGSGITLITVNYSYMAKPLVAAIGDSITAGAIKHAPNPNHYSGVDDYGNSYPKLISDYMKEKGIKNYFVVNRGVNSDTTSGMLSRFNDEIVNTGCKYVFIHGGINDYQANDTSSTVQNKIDMFNLATTNNIVAIILGILPTKTTNVAHQYSINVRALENATYDQEKYIDIWNAIEGAAINVADDTKMDDSVHPNIQGYINIANKIKTNISFQ